MLRCPSIWREQGPDKAPSEPLFLLLRLILVALDKHDLAELKVDDGSACAGRGNCILPPPCINSCILKGT